MTGKAKWAVFETPIGTCGVAWNEAGLLGVQLPERSPAATRARMERRWAAGAESEPSEEIARLIRSIGALLQGQPIDFQEVSLDLAGVTEFNLRVYRITREIPAGQVLTYGEIARRLGDLSLSRDVGQALGQNPWPLVIPCHRVVAAGGKPGGFSGGVGTPTKLQLLRIEGAVLGDQPSLFDGLTAP